MTVAVDLDNPLDSGLAMGGMRFVPERAPTLFSHRRSATRERPSMALPFDVSPANRDPRTLSILAKTIYRELRASGYSERDVMALAGEMLGIVATEVKDRRQKP